MIFKKIKKWILPKEIDFFGDLKQQSIETQKIIEELNEFYTSATSNNTEPLLNRIAESKKNNSANLKKLNATFITPVDREALSRVYTQLYWIVLSIKHLIVEIEAYKIYDLSEYQEIFNLLNQEQAELTKGFEKLQAKKYPSVHEHVDAVIQLDNELIKVYVRILSELFRKNNFPELLMHKEILSQLKEISKRIHISANLLIDIIFKID